MSHLLNAASIPYFDILHKWIYIGQLNDVYEEFMVSDNKHKLQDASKWWNDRFTLHEVNIWITFTTTPTFSPSLNHGRKSIPEIILTVGKYLNLIHECSRDSELTFSSNYLELSQEPSIQLSDGILSISTKIQTAYEEISSMLTTIIFDQHQLLHRMRTVIKRYFLLHHQGPDFFSDFLNNAESELLQEVQLISRDRIQTLMNMASHFPSNEVNGHTADVLSFDFAPLSLIDHLDALHSISGGIKLSDTSKLQIQEDNNTRLTGIEAFMLDYHIETLPLSLIISQRSISNYQLIFRHLFFVKHVERRLFSVWLDHQTIKELQLRGELGETYCLRQQMLHFLQNLVYYMMFEVIGT